MEYRNTYGKDRELIDEMAELWVNGGGDLDGIMYCFYAITERVSQIEKEREKERHEND